MGASQRRKGHGFERECAILLREIFPKVSRHLEYQYDQALGFDLDNTGPFRFQCKAMKKYAPISAIEEIGLSALPPEAIPALITKGDRKPEVVCIYLVDFLKLLKKAGYSENPL